MRKGLKGDSAEIEWESFKCSAGRLRFCNSRASTGRVRIFRSPLRVSDLLRLGMRLFEYGNALTYSLSVPMSVSELVVTYQIIAYNHYSPLPMMLRVLSKLIVGDQLFTIVH